MDEEGNELRDEKSLYLQQHADNPVNWYPWCDEAFEKAKEEDIPIFLSIGYSSCHWCHVMAHESFEDEEVAQLMNETFVSIKVDKEERPEINKYYMDVARRMSRQSGWPLTIMMTPERKPFFAATYIPKRTRGERVGLVELTKKVKDLWENDRGGLIETGENVLDSIKRDGMEPGDGLKEEDMDSAYRNFKRNFDKKAGGFGISPKFPSPQNLLFLMRYWARSGEERSLEMVKETLDSMRKGGIHDHLGSGFHRYSTDRHWKLPHFEKMLYDQAMLGLAYTEGYQATGDKKYVETVEDIMGYVLSRLSDGQAFYSAEDADVEDVEGGYYTWTVEEIKDTLEEDPSLLLDTFNVKEEGNFEEESSGELTGKNVLFRDKSYQDIASAHDLSKEELKEKMNELEEKLLEERKERERPARDNKILTDWNGLIIKSLAKAGFVLNEERYVQAAEDAADFLLKNMVYEGNKLYHSYIEGEASVEGNLDDYSFFIAGLLELYQTTFQTEYMRRALELTDTMLEDFWDDEKGGFYFTSERGVVPSRKKEVRDGPYPSGNSMSFLVLATLYKMSGDEEYREKAEGLQKAFCNQVSSMGSEHAMFLSAFDLFISPGPEIVLVGERDGERLDEMKDVLRSIYLPKKVILFKDVLEPAITDIAPFTEDMESENGATTAYVCQDFACKEPITDVEEFERALSEKR